METSYFLTLPPSFSRLGGFLFLEGPGSQRIT
nr:hypothetical protein JMPHXYHW_JMPHXYHW_CDS_0020 [uncultured phage]